jgi:hypothetical protein
MATLDAATSELRTWYNTYVAAFTSLAAGTRDDRDTLLEFYGAPVVIVTDTSYAELLDHAAVKTFFGTQIDQLRAANYASSTLHSLTVRPLNARAALFDAVVSRQDRAGQELSRFGAVYLAAKTADGWRFTALVITAA